MQKAKLTAALTLLVTMFAAASCGGTARVPGNNRHQAIAEAVREGLQNSQAGAAGFGAAPQYHGEVEGSHKPDTLMTITLEGEECTFADHADYGIYVPSTAKQIHGVMVFQHGCSQEEFGLSRHCDVQYQAFARKWNLAIVETNIYGLCDIWAFPENGSYKALLLALARAGAKTSHSELPQAPFLLWGHSGGGLWVLAMLNQHPERILSAVCYSAAWDPQWDYLPEAFDVPVILRHAGPGEGADNIPATARHTFAKLRSNNAPASIAFTRGQGHNYSFMRTMTIPFWEASLKQRLADDGTLRPLDPQKTWLGDTITFEIFREADYQGCKTALCRLPDRECAEAWSEYASSGKVTDKTPPQTPYNLKLETDGDSLKISWMAEADIESGIGCFQIYINGEQVGRIPEQGNYQEYDHNGDQARPVNPPAMSFYTALPASLTTIAVEAINRDGLASAKAELVFKPQQAK